MHKAKSRWSLHLQFQNISVAEFTKQTYSNAPGVSFGEGGRQKTKQNEENMMVKKTKKELPWTDRGHCARNHGT